jgi:uncharacterized protein YjbI with pentapeptide repeats
VVGYDGGQYVTKEHKVQQEPQNARERAVLLLRATFLPAWSSTASQRLVWAIRGATVLGVLILIASAVDKPLWDWLDLLIVPAVLAIGGYLFNSSQNQATQRAAEQRAQDDALQAYLDHMSDMLIPKKDQPSLYETGPDADADDNLSTVARARTLTVLARLDGYRKASVVWFLYEADLIDRDGRIWLGNADLREAALDRSYMPRINLSKADLSRADLSESWLSEADLSYADLSYADLNGTDLNETKLSGTTMKGADLSDAKVTQEQLDQTYTLEGATMPNGQKYEEWLKSRGSR